MQNEKRGLYLGLEINDHYAMVSYFQPNMGQPQTLSTIMGSENYQIPLLLAKKKGMGQWYVGSEAKQRAASGEAVLVDKLLDMALTGGDIYVDHIPFGAADLMTIFVTKVLALAGMAYTRWPIAKLVIALDTVSVAHMGLFSAVSSKLNLDSQDLLLIDSQEAFYYYALSQRPELYWKDVALFDYRSSDVISTVLHRNTGTKPQLITLDQRNQGKLLDNRDQQLLDLWLDDFEDQDISTVYLIGDGFDGDWAKESLHQICHNRKVYLGKNLYSKGACYCGAIKDGQQEWGFAYIGANELKLNLYLKVVQDNDLQLFTLLSAGESWLESKGECEVILEGSPEIEFFIQEPDCREANIELIELTDLPERERRTTRLRITATPASDREIEIVIRDFGFGEIARSTGKTWMHTIVLQ